jgi:hypothetical protein
MALINEFERIIDIYRKIGRPKLINGQVNFSGKISDTANKELRALWSFENCRSKITIGHNGRRFQNHIDDPYPAFTEQDIVSLVIEFPGGNYKISSDLNTYLSSDNLLNLAEEVGEVYLASEDYIFGDEPGDSRPEIKKALAISKVIFNLKELSSFKDKDQVSNTLKLVFVNTDPDEKELRDPLILKPRITPDLLSGELNYSDILNNIVNPASDKLHMEEKCSLLRMSLLELLKANDEQDDNFKYLILHWNALISIYRGNYESYLTKFSFLKQKKEASENYIDISSKLGKCLSTISGKLYGLPVSLAVPLTIIKSTKSFEGILLVAGSALVSFLIFLTVREQAKTVKVIKASIAATFTYSEADSESSLSRLINEQKRKLKKQASHLLFWLFIFSLLAYVPTLISLMTYFYKYEHNTFDKITHWCINFWSLTETCITDFRLVAVNYFQFNGGAEMINRFTMF